MENFIVSARKYRPTTFDMVVGQSALVTTLKNAIESKKIAHAYLFCGPRGVGKTTTARILAKAINCQDTSSSEPCNKCESCIAFNEGRSYNIHELDAASNNSVENIRELVDQVRIPPQMGSYSVYIIDEVHMLSQAAFNAFLKTLEEPPSYAIFILATTEKNKILPTILSRCQVYDFNRISVNDTVNHLKSIAEKEGITAEEDALNVIAVKSDGGMRDALSTFDQVVSFCGKNITYKDVVENLNILDYDYYFKLTQTCFEMQIPSALVLINEILSKGFEVGNIISGLLEHARDLLVCKNPETAMLLNVGAGIREKYLKQAEIIPQDFLLDTLELCNQAELEYKQSKNKRLLLELLIIRMCQLMDVKKKKSKFLRKKNNKPSILPFFTVTAPVVSAQAPASKPIAAPVTKKVEATPPTPKKTTIINGDNKSKLGKLLLSRNNNTDENTQSQNNLRNNEFTAEQLGASWLSFSKRIPDLPDIHYVFNKEPEINGTEIKVVVTSSIVENKLYENMPLLKQHLCNDVKNDYINVVIELDKSASTTLSLTPKEKARLMNEKNPHLMTLFKEWKLKLY